jgi:hypothetical protein
MKWCAVLLLMALWLDAQTPVNAPKVEPIPHEMREMLAREFGPDYHALPEYSPLLADFDRDGQQDAAIAVTAKNPLVGAVGHDYKVLDPYNSFFGFGDPKITTDYAVPMHPGPPRHLVIAHDWKASKPKLKFVIVNLPFDTLQVAQTRWKKKPLDAIAAADATGVTGLVFWNGKKYKYEPSGGGM